MYGRVTGKLAGLFLLLGLIPKILSFLAFFTGAWWLSAKLPELASKPYATAVTRGGEDETGGPAGLSAL